MFEVQLLAKLLSPLEPALKRLQSCARVETILLGGSTLDITESMARPSPVQAKPFELLLVDGTR